MIKILKIVNIIAVVAAVGAILFLAKSALGGGGEPPSALTDPGPIEEFRLLINLSGKIREQESPLVRQAKIFAIKIDPPPPPIPLAPKNTEVTDADPRPPEVEGPKVIKTKFSLVATCKYKDKPEKSLALLNIPPKEPKWYRQGEKVGYFTIHEVKDGSIVLYQGGRKNSEMFAPQESSIKSLLKSDSDEAADFGGDTAITQMKQPKQILIPDTSTPPPSRRPGSRIIRRPPTRSSRTISRRQVAKQTPEQQKTSIKSNISRIQNLMEKPSPGATEKRKEAEKKAWADLLQKLQKDLVDVETTEKTPQKPAEKPAADEKSDPKPVQRAKRTRK